MTPREEIYAGVAVGLGIVLLLSLLVLAYASHVKKVDVELHSYQKDFLDTLGKDKSLGAFILRGDASSALSWIVRRAMRNPSVRSEIFDTFHCVHCGSVKPPEWISTRKGDKRKHKLKLDPPLQKFLSGELLLPVEKRGTPPARQVIEGPKRADLSKAARCCVDWAIKNEGRFAEKPKPE